MKTDGVVVMIMHWAELGKVIIAVVAVVVFVQ